MGETYIRWTNEEWAAVGRRAQALRAHRPDLNWVRAVTASQDDIATERRRLNLTKLAEIKPMFDALGLDDQGNIPPPPPEPEPPPTPEPPPAPPVAIAPPPVSAIPTSVLLAELFSRGEAIKAEYDKVVAQRNAIEIVFAEQAEMMTTVMKRVDEVEALAIESMGKMDAINVIHAEFTALAKEVKEDIRCAVETQSTLPQAVTARKEVLGIEPLFKPQSVPAIAPVRFLLIGPQTKDIVRIKERLPRALNVDLQLSENDPQVKLPANVHYCLISGHADYAKCWQVARAAYGDNAVRMDNGSIGTYANQVEILTSTHTHKGNGVQKP
jgi:hypothetical protein